ncbi:MAG: hypothetical protein ACI9IN_000976, partial [Porticoccaceae bacterium]
RSAFLIATSSVPSASDSAVIATKPMLTPIKLMPFYAVPYSLIEANSMT